MLSMAPELDGSTWDGNLQATRKNRSGAHQLISSVSEHSIEQLLFGRKRYARQFPRQTRRAHGTPLQMDDAPEGGAAALLDRIADHYRVTHS